MQAIIKTGGKQYRVSKGEVINVEKLEGKAGEEHEFKEVLYVSDEGGNTKVGTPYVENSIVRGKILGTVKGKKITIFKFKRRKAYRKKQGHRQKYTSVEITDIVS